jgi:DNA polymerase III subunit epsilon
VPAWQLLAIEPWLAFDAETTGRGERAEVVEAAIVDATGGVLFDGLVRPTGPMSPGAERLHGLSGGRLAAAPAFGEHHPRLHELLAGRVVVAYHAAFDRRVLATSCALIGRPEIPATWLCAVDLFESLRGFRPPLHVACEIEGVAGPRERHRALSDAVALQALVVKLREVAAAR